jgi:hypothetical protein
VEIILSNFTIFQISRIVRALISGESFADHGTHSSGTTPAVEVDPSRLYVRWSGMWTRMPVWRRPSLLCDQRCIGNDRLGNK